MDSQSNPAGRVDVAGIGVNAADRILLLPEFPHTGGKMEIREAQQQLGGQVATAIIACQSWGLRTRYAGKVGADAIGEAHAQAFQRAQVEAHLLRVPNCRSQSSVTLVDQRTGERTILWERDARLAIRAAELKRRWVSTARALLVDGHDAAAAACAAKWARQCGIPVVADVDSIYPGVKELLEVTDYLIAAEEFPCRFTGKRNIQEALQVIVRRFGCRLAGATMGARGALAFTGSRWLHSAAYKVKAVDTTGAGDIFHAAFVYGLLRGWPVERTLDFSNAAAALNCTAVGARGHIAGLKEIERFMANGPRCLRPPQGTKGRKRSKPASEPRGTQAR